MYKVIKHFTDLHDKNHPYNVGDEYPREGITVTEARIAELAGSDNKQKTPLIEMVEEEPTDEEGSADEEEPGQEVPAVEDMTIAQLKEVAAQMGIDTTGFKKKADYVNAIGTAE